MLCTTKKTETKANENTQAATFPKHLLLPSVGRNVDKELPKVFSRKFHSSSVLKSTVGGFEKNEYSKVMKEKMYL